MDKIIHEDLKRQLAVTQKEDFNMFGVELV